MLSFDVQAHEGVLQIMTAGAGTAHLLPGEYLHCTQFAIDALGLRCQTLDTAGQRREALCWPLPIDANDAKQAWHELQQGVSEAPVMKASPSATATDLLILEISAMSASSAVARAQTLLSAWQSDSRLALLWIGLCGPKNELTVALAPVEGRSPQIWRGPPLRGRERFSFQLAIHGGMGPGGFLWRWSASSPWSSLTTASHWGPERLGHCEKWSIGHDRAVATRRPFLGSDLRVRWCSTFASVE